MINLNKVPNQIKTDGLFSYIYDEMREELNQEELNENQIKEYLVKSEKHLDEYRRLNKDIEVTNIHLKDLIITDQDSDESKKIKKQINKNANTLRALEKYSLSSNDSAYPIWIGSLVVFGIFTIHNFFGLFTDVYHTMPALIYGSYILIMAYGYYFYKRTLKKHDRKNKEYKEIFNNTQKLIDTGMKKGYFTNLELYS